MKKIKNITCILIFVLAFIGNAQQKVVAESSPIRLVESLGAFKADSALILPIKDTEECTWLNSQWHKASLTLRPQDSTLYYCDGTRWTKIVSNNITGATGSFGYVVVNNGIITSGKRLELYSGTTNASGVYTVTFGTPFSVAPNIQASIANQSATNQFLRVTSVSTTGFTINVFQRNSVSILGIDVLLSTTVNVNGASIDAVAYEK